MNCKLVVLDCSFFPVLVPFSSYSLNSFIELPRTVKLEEEGDQYLEENITQKQIEEPTRESMELENKDTNV